MQAIKISIYLLAFVLSNYVVLWFGKTGLIFTALFLIPFDFVMRCIFHETWKGKELVLKLGALVSVASLITIFINRDAEAIAIASATSFFFAQAGAGLIYQLTINKSYLIKVNGSDAVGILIDSILFQLIAFNSIDYSITAGQFTLKIIGGILWYWLLFHKFKIQKKLL